jgi:hypothetical protein
VLLQIGAAAEGTREERQQEPIGLVTALGGLRGAPAGARLPTLKKLDTAADLVIARKDCYCRTFTLWAAAVGC